MTVKSKAGKQLMGISVFRNHTEISELQNAIENWACSHQPRRYEGV
jgi:hypothetical protein